MLKWSDPDNRDVCSSDVFDGSDRPDLISSAHGGIGCMVAKEVVAGQHRVRGEQRAAAICAASGDANEHIRKHAPDGRRRRSTMSGMTERNGSAALPVTFPAAIYRQRLSRVQALVYERGLGGAIIGTGSELAYLTGSWTTSHERLTALVVPPAGDIRLLAPATDATALGPVAEEIGIQLSTWRDGENPYVLAEKVCGSGRIAVGSSLTADHVLRLQEVAGDVVLATDVLAEAFMVKGTEEIEQLAFAAAAIDRVHDQVPDLLQAGRTEREVAADLDELILREHSRTDFIIVGSGPHGADPHHDYSDRVLEEGDPVVVDIGGTVGAGYHSDCTRTFVVGDKDKASAEFSRAYEVLRRAQADAVAAARPGMTAGDLDAVARGRINEAGYGSYFTHRLGHGIGLGLHEEPFIIARSEMVLQPGMVFSIEPGIYIPGKWGMRIEDIVVLEDGGARSLNATPK